MKQQFFYPESTFGGFTGVDGTVAFYSRVNALAQASFRVIDFGCGRGKNAEDPILFRRNLMCLKGKVAQVIGLDVDEAGKRNPTLDDFRLLTPDGPWPLDDQSADLIVCDSVLEHLPNPSSFFAEAKRVLAHDGYLCIRTPNVLSYVGVAARVIPNRYHNKIVSRVQLGRKEEDVFPTLCRCNTIRALRKQMVTNGFRAVVYGHESEPGYLHFSKVAYGLGVLHQKIAPGFIRPVIFAFGQLSM